MTRRWNKPCCFLLQAMEGWIAPLEQSTLRFWENHLNICYINVEQIFIPYYSSFFVKDGK